MSVAFPVLNDLPQAEQNEINRINAIPANSRKGSEVSHLAARSTVVSNVILDKDPAGNITRCESNAAPTTTVAGFAKGCLWYNTAAAVGNNGAYINVGTTTVAQWQQVTSA